MTPEMRLVLRCAAGCSSSALSRGRPRQAGDRPLLRSAGRGEDFYGTRVIKISLHQIFLPIFLPGHACVPCNIDVIDVVGQTKWPPDG